MYYYVQFYKLLWNIKPVLKRFILEIFSSTGGVYRNIDFVYDMRVYEIRIMTWHRKRVKDYFNIKDVEKIVYLYYLLFIIIIIIYISKY